MQIPDHGMDRTALFAMLEEYRVNDANWRSGKVWGYVYDAGEEVDNICKQAYTMFLTENGLDPTVYPSQLRLENDIVAMAASHLRGDKDVVGSFTSGGTESLILAVKTARDYARAMRPQIQNPEMVLPYTAHASFHKAGQLLNVKPVLVPVDKTSFKVQVDEIEKAITADTILLVGSAPSYAHGVIDPIEQLAALAIKHKLLLHVDACIGGFLLPYFRLLGENVPDFDFQVPGVTSISMDLHKYAYAAKGASVLLHRNKNLRKYQYFSCAKWPGYSVINSTLQSTKSVGPLAGAWAVLHFLGKDGYLQIAADLLAATRKIIAGIEQIAELQILGSPQMTLLAFSSDKVDVFHVADEMKERGWYVQVQLAFSGGKQNLHLSVGPSSTKWTDDLLADLKESVAKAKKLKPGGLASKLKQTLAKIASSTMSEESMLQMMSMVGITDGQLPERMAEINTILNSMPPEICESVLIQFFNDLYVPTNKINRR